MRGSARLTASLVGYQQNLGGRSREEVELAPGLTGVAGFGVEATTCSRMTRSTAFRLPAASPTA